MDWLRRWLKDTILIRNNHKEVNINSHQLITCSAVRFNMLLAWLRYICAKITKVNTLFSSPPLGVVSSRDLENEPVPFCAMKLGGAVALSNNVTCPSGSLQCNADAINNTQHREVTYYYCASAEYVQVLVLLIQLCSSKCHRHHQWAPNTVLAEPICLMCSCAVGWSGMQPRATLGMPWDGNPGCPKGAAGCCPRMSRAGVPGYRGYRGCRPGMFRGSRGGAPGCRGVKLLGVGGWSSGLPPAVPSPHVSALPSSGRCRQQLHRVPAPAVFPTVPSAPAGWGWAARPARGWAAGAGAGSRGGRAGRRSGAAPGSSGGCSPGRSCGRSPWAARAPRRAAGSRSNAAPGRAAAAPARWQQPWPARAGAQRPPSFAFPDTSSGPGTPRAPPVLPRSVLSALLAGFGLPMQMDCDLVMQNSLGPGLDFHWLSKEVPVICIISFPPWISRFCKSESCWHEQSADPAGRAVAQDSTVQTLSD